MSVSLTEDERSRLLRGTRNALLLVSPFWGHPLSDRPDESYSRSTDGEHRYLSSSLANEPW